MWRSVCSGCRSGVTHCDQAALVLPVGAVRPQDGHHHGDGAHQVQHEEAGGPMGHLEEDRVVRDRSKSRSVCVSERGQNDSQTYQVAMGTGQDLGQQRQAQDDSAHHLTHSQFSQNKRAALMGLHAHIPIKWPSTE